MRGEKKDVGVDLDVCWEWHTGKSLIFVIWVLNNLPFHLHFMTAAVAEANKTHSRNHPLLGFNVFLHYWFHGSKCLRILMLTFKSINTIVTLYIKSETTKLTKTKCGQKICYAVLSSLWSWRPCGWPTQLHIVITKHTDTASMSIIHTRGCVSIVTGR